MSNNDISQNSRRVARNTVFLWFRMLVLLFIGLFSSRLVLKALGIEDVGVYNAVGGVVTIFSMFIASTSQAISRYMAYSLGGNDGQKMKKVFSTSLALQLILAVAIALLVETAGVWFLTKRMSIPDGRMPAAFLVLQCSLVTLVFQLFSIPYNALIIAHEKMGAFAYISILEGLLKLAVALLLFVLPGDSLKAYALLMMSAAFIVRLTYAVYCRRHFPESHAGIRFHKDMLKEMGNFAGWSFFGSSAYIVNTQGASLLSNVFFGVVVNAARGYATQIEGMIKPFINGFTTAINPQITKSYAAGDEKYCHELVEKGSRFILLMLLVICIPVCFEMHILVNLWLGQVPEHLVTFARLLLISNLAMCLQPVATLQLATGNVKKYFITVGGLSYLNLPVCWILFHFGAPTYIPYVVFIVVDIATSAAKLAIIHRQIGFPVAGYLRTAVLRPLLIGGVSVLLTWLVWLSMEEGFLRLVLVSLVSVLSMGLGTWLFALTEGEKKYVLGLVKIKH